MRAEERSYHAVSQYGIEVSVFPAWVCNHRDEWPLRIRHTEAKAADLQDALASLSIPHKLEQFGRLRFIYVTNTTELVALILVGGVVAVSEFLRDEDTVSVLRPFFGV